MKYSTFRQFRKDLDSKKFKVSSSTENDSIGAYEYCGQRGVDRQPDYISGEIELLIPEVLSDLELASLLDKYEDLLGDKMMSSENIMGEDVEFESIRFSSHKDHSSIYIPYTASPEPAPEYEEER